VTGDVVVGAGAYLDFDAAPNTVTVGGSVEIHGHGDLRRVTSVGNSVIIASANGQLGLGTFPGVESIPGDLTIQDIDLLGTQGAQMLTIVRDGLRIAK